MSYLQRYMAVIVVPQPANTVPTVDLTERICDVAFGFDRQPRKPRGRGGTVVDKHPTEVHFVRCNTASHLQQGRYLLVPSSGCSRLEARSIGSSSFPVVMRRTLFHCLNRTHSKPCHTKQNSALPTMVNVQSSSSAHPASANMHYPTPTAVFEIEYFGLKRLDAEPRVRC